MRSDSSQIIQLWCLLGGNLEQYNFFSLIPTLVCRLGLVYIHSSLMFLDSNWILLFLEFWLDIYFIWHHTREIIVWRQHHKTCVAIYWISSLVYESWFSVYFHYISSNFHETQESIQTFEGTTEKSGCFFSVLSIICLFVLK